MILKLHEARCIPRISVQSRPDNWSRYTGFYRNTVENLNNSEKSALVSQDPPAGASTATSAGRSSLRAKSSCFEVSAWVSADWGLIWLAQAVANNVSTSTVLDARTAVCLPSARASPATSKLCIGHWRPPAPQPWFILSYRVLDARHHMTLMMTAQTCSQKTDARCQKSHDSTDTITENRGKQ